MSIRFIGTVWDSGLYDGPRLLMMLALADHADDDGWCWPNYETLALKIRRNVKTVYRILSELESEGAIQRLDGRIGIVEPHIVDEVARRAEAAQARSAKPPQKRLNSEKKVLNSENGVLTSEKEILKNEKPYYIDPSINRQGEPIAHDPQRPQAPADSPSPPVNVKIGIRDRTPGGRGYHPPAEPPPPAARPRPEPTAEQRAIADMANAITDATGISARLNWSEVSGFAEELVRAGYTPQQIREHYGSEKVADRWHWYESDWRGKKGDRPRLKEIRETIAGAVIDRPGNPQQENNQSWLEKSIRMARANGLLPSAPSNIASPADS